MSWKNKAEKILKKLKGARSLVIPLSFGLLFSAGPIKKLLKEESVETIPFSEFMKNVRNDRVTGVVLDGEEASGTMLSNAGKDGETKRFRAVLTPRADVTKDLLEHNVRTEVKSQRSLFSLFDLTNMLFVGLLFYQFRMMQNGMGTNRRFSNIGEKPKVRFKDVAGIDEVRQELEEVVAFLKKPEDFQNLGAKVPRGVLLHGAPGTGKTLTARAVAGEAGVPFFSVSGSDFVELFVGNGARRVRALFEKARKSAPCIIFIDELDALGRSRTAMSGNDEREQTLNQLLTEMDGFTEGKGIIVMAATNRPDVLDPALTRPGRFDRKIFVPLPDVKGREEILKIHTRRMPLADDVDLKGIAHRTPGFSGADLENLANEASLWASRQKADVIDAKCFEAAQDKILMGPERASYVMSPRIVNIVSFHEAGHALVSLNNEDSMPLHKVSIVPRGQAMGVTVHTPNDELLLQSKGQMKAFLQELCAGREAEKLVFGEDAVTVGAANDLSKATEIARDMVAKFGMSDDFGSVCLDNERKGGLNFQSSEVENRIESSVRKIVQEAEKAARTVLQDQRPALDALATALKERETLTGAEVTTLVASFRPSRTRTTSLAPGQGEGA